MISSSLDNIADAVRTSYRASFTRAVAESQAKPLVLPYSLLGPFIVPTLWLTIPHRHRPWLYQTRWLVMLFVILFDVDLIRHTSSLNVAAAFATGLMASWGIFATMNLLVWTRPQWDAARVMRRRKTKVVTVEGEGMNGKATAHENGLQENGVRLRGVRKTLKEEERSLDESEFAYYWQTFPEDAPFLERLGWVFDLTVSFRFSGWNCSVSAVPRPEIPSDVRPHTAVNFDSMPVISKYGFKRCLTETEFFHSRLLSISVCYMALDFLSVFMMKDPYFIFGPGHPTKHHLPAYLQGVHPWFILAYRQLFGLAGVYNAIEAIFCASDLVQYLLLRRLCPGRGELWMFATTFGSFSQVLDRGLAGWWASYWHQTFRTQFLAPAAYLTRHGYLTRGSSTAMAVTLFLSFVSSGLLHGSGSVTSLPPKSKPGLSFIFFVLQAVGILAQRELVKFLHRRVDPSPAPRWLSRLGNLIFVTVWLHLTASFFVDDISSAGIWLLEPVPISPLRWLGFGHPGDHWWRWDRAHFPRWHTGERWWQSGFAI